jgi:hypothetical protein
MANDNSIPAGLTRAKTAGNAHSIEKESLDDVSARINGLLSVLKEDLSSKEESKKIDANFKRLINRLKAEQDASILMIKEMKRSGAAEEEIIARLSKDAKERMKNFEGVKKSIKDLIYDSDTFNDDQRSKMSEQISLLEKSLTFQERAENFQKSLIDLQKMQFDIQLSQRQKIKESLEKSLNDLLEEDKLKRREDELRERLEKDYRLEDKKFQNMRDKDAKALQKRREREDKKASDKGSFVAAMLGPLRLITDPFLKFTKGKSTEEYFQSKFEKSLEKRRDAEDESIRERQDKEDKERERARDIESKKNGFYIEAQMRLDQLAGGKAALSPEFERREREMSSQQEQLSEQEMFQKNIAKLSNSIVSGISSPFRKAKETLNKSVEFTKGKAFHGLNKIFTGASAAERNAPPPGVESVLAPAPEEALRREISAPSVESVLALAPSETLQREIPPPGVESVLAPAPEEALRREISAPSVESVLAHSPVTPFIGEDMEDQEQLAEYNPLLEKIAPNRSSLLGRGGVIGASAVYLGNLLGDQLDDMTEGQDKKEGEGGLLDGLFGKGKTGGLFTKLLPTLASASGVAAVAAIPVAMLAGGMALQKRDAADARDHFEKGDAARGAETLWLGDRSRLTEENANAELGRATGKTALLAGGAAGIGALTLGGGAAAGMAAGGAASAAGAGVLGTGLAAAGAAAAAVLPPVLIGAAVAAGVTIIAKGTQEAFELGWDKNQANIQKELNSTIFDEDASVWEKIKAGAGSVWKGFTGSLAGGIREAGSVLDAETMIQNEKQIKFLREQADAGNKDYARLLDLMQNEQFKTMDENERKMLMQAEGLYDDYEKMRQETQKSFGEHLLTAGRTVGGFFTGLADTSAEAVRGKKTARWEAEILKGLEKTSDEDIARLKQSKEFQDTMANGGSEKDAMEAAYLKEQKDEAVARGDLTKDGMVIQQSGALFGGLAGNKLGKYFGFGDMGLAYKERKTGSKELDNEYRQTFEYSKRKAELMDECETAEEADLAVIAEQNQLYHDSLTLRLKQSKEYKETFDSVLKETGDIKKAENEGLKAASKNKKNTMATNKLMKAKFTEVWKTVKDFAGNVGGWFKDKFSAAGQGMANLGKAIADGASAVWGSVTEWASGLWKWIGEKFTKVLDWLKNFGGGLLDVGKAGLDWLGDKASGAWSWLTGEERSADSSINDGIVLKNGKVIEISPDDNVYATKNEPRVIRDQEAQAAMPSVQKTPAEFTDKNIVATLQAILDRLNKMDIKPQVVTSGGDINFDGLKMAGNL